ncbi:malonate--CoA ligase [Sulfurisoma sediminicola]|uniref:Malonyl-CoA/methylmalonyl-CoA synthetase n=1 Tax=Sulfurisoma sediminicola TaxID=1381557 RepID=A0A497XQD0_9PROT|nr:malonyl-CoA synthase [Sulfurisoma sediminicola]RLJ68339.1 malonyl-CoA/methylmalonyl-CoA synthetase [Sulfurisoma sediminicola]
MNLYALLTRHFPKDPRAPCMILPDGRVWTYGDIERASGRIANLIASLGLRPGDRVAAQVEKSAEALVLYLACLRAGMVFLPLNPAYQRHELEYFLGDAQPGLFVCRPQMRTLADEVAAKAGVAHVLELDDAGHGSLVDAAAPHADAFRTVARQDSDLAAILYTSGTTGRSKGAMLTHGNLGANAKTLHAYWHFRKGDVLLHMLPIFHVHGLFVACHTSLLNGSAMFWEPKFDAKQAMSLLPQATVMMGVPTYYVRLLLEPGFTRETCRSVRLFVSGSAPLLRETFDEFRTRTGHTILERYGMTEGGMFTSNPYDGERRGGTVGFPLPGTEVRIVMQSGIHSDGAGDAPQEVPLGDTAVKPGEIGGIQVRGANVFVGYWRMPEKTQEEFTADGFFRTGDMGSWDKDGYIVISGRSKDLIITGGLNVYPKEIEELIDALPGVAESAVIGLPHPDFGEAVTAVVVRQKNAAGEALSEAGIIAAVKAEFANFKVPKRVFLVDDLPRNAMGKVQKNLLRDEYSGK